MNVMNFVDSQWKCRYRHVFEKCLVHIDIWCVAVMQESQTQPEIRAIDEQKVYHGLGIPSTSER